MRARTARAVRGWAITLVSALVAGVLHAGAGGVFPAFGAVLLAAAFAGLLSMLLSSRRFRTASLAVSVAVDQLAFHAVYALGPAASAVRDMRMPGGAEHPVLAGAGVAGAGAAGAATGSAGMGADGMGDGVLAHLTHGGPVMVVAHAVGAVLSVLLIRYADAALASIVSSAGRIVVAATTALAPVPLPGAVPASAWRRPPVVPASVRVARLRYRGPPALLSA